MRVRCGGRRVRDPRRRDNSGTQPTPLRHLEQRRQRIRQGRFAVAARYRSANAQYARSCFLTRYERGHGAGTVGHLQVRVVRLDQRNVRKRLERQLVLLAGFALELARENTCGRNGTYTHAVANEQHHIARRRHRVARNCRQSTQH